MDEVDWLLDRLSEQVDTRDREIARLRSVLHVEPVPAEDEAEPELLTHPFPAVRDASEAEDGNGSRPRAVPDEPRWRDTGARPAGPVRDIRTHDQAEPE
jgi:hypothetical protein